MHHTRPLVPDAFGGSLKQDVNSEFTIIGIPFDDKSSYRKGAAGGPAAIRTASSARSINSFTETGLDLSRDTSLFDSGDVGYNENYSSFISEVENAVSRAVERGSIPVSLGGDHSITFPIVKGMLNHFKKLNLVWLDAHPDIYPEFDGDKYSHACPLMRILELEGIETVILAGIRATSPDLNKSLKDAGVQVITSSQFEEASGLSLSGPTYLTIDIDLLDPAFAPGVGNPVPGGIGTRELIDTIHSFRFPIVGFDLVEVNPAYDHSAITAAAGAKIVMETIGHIVSGKT